MTDARTRILESWVTRAVEAWANARSNRPIGDEMRELLEEVGPLIEEDVRNRIAEEIRTEWPVADASEGSDAERHYFTGLNDGVAGALVVVEDEPQDSETDVLVAEVMRERESGREACLAQEAAASMFLERAEQAEGIGDQFQSEASRLAESVDFDALPYEAQMSVVAIRRLVDEWTALRAGSTKRKATELAFHDAVLIYGVGSAEAHQAYVAMVREQR